MLASSEPSKPKKTFFSEWLEKLQQESWQLELLISGLALFGIWESRSMLYKFEYYLSTNTVYPYDGLAVIFVYILWAGWGIFMVNLLIHIIIRGLWIGAIGLRYVSGDIDFDEMNYSEIFVKYFKRRIGSFDDYIERLEKLSSVLFSFTFLLFFIIFSFVFVNIVFITIGSTINSIFYPDHDGLPTGSFIVVFLLYSFGLLVLIDFVTLGAFKKVKDKTFSRAYFWLYRFYSTISLSFIYRPLLLNFIDNRYTKNLFFLSLPYLLILLFGFRLSSFERYTYIPSFDNERYQALVDKYSINWNNYDDLRSEHLLTFSDNEIPYKKENIKYASLTQYEYSGTHGAVFMVYQKRDSKLIERQNPDLKGYKKAGYRHSMFSPGRMSDPAMEKMIENELHEIRGMIKVIRGQEDQLDSLEQKLIVSDIESYRQMSTDDISRLRGEIENRYRKSRKAFSEDKLNKVKSAILKNYSFELNDVDYKDSLVCSFFIHPNMHEQGLMCYFPIDSLESGQHMIRLLKRYDRNDCVDNCPYFEKYLPFRKL